MPSQLASKPCHTCRRRRRKCDQALPRCQKCASDGLECLGYDKLILWERGVASRGKMMGKSFSKPPPVTINTQKSNKTGPKVWITESSQEESLESDIATGQRQHAIAMPLDVALADPFFQSLSPKVRRYVKYFAENLVGYYVLHDLPGQNPMRGLICAAQASSLLLHTMVANSACHVYNLSVAHYSLSLEIGSGDFKIPNPPGPQTQLTIDSHTDALIAKHQTLQLLSKAIRTVDASTIDMTLAAIVALLNYELLEAGKNSWDVHISGARRLVSILDSLTGSKEMISKVSQVRMFCLSELLVMSILGATFMHQNNSWLSLPPSVDFDHLLKFTESNNYLSCPAPLLRIMLRSFEQPESEPGTALIEDSSNTRDIDSLLCATLSFDCQEWLTQFEPMSPFDDLTKRFHIASAHKSAVCLFLLRARASSSCSRSWDGVQLVDIHFHVENIIQHISQITPDDATFQSTCWPAFLAGAEAETMAQRQWVCDRMNALWEYMHWGYIRTAQEVLDIIWRSKDESVDGGSQGWVETVRKTGVKYLIA